MTGGGAQSRGDPLARTRAAGRLWRTIAHNKKAMELGDTRAFEDSSRAQIARALDAAMAASSPIGMPVQMGSLVMFVPPQPEFGGIRADRANRNAVLLERAKILALDRNMDIR